MPKVHFINEIISVDVPRGAILRDVALAQGVEIFRGMWTHINCRGLGLCGRCRIWVLSSKSNVSKPSMIRERILHRVHGDLRLACQVRILGDVEIRTRPLGPAVVKPVGEMQPASYKEAAEQRYIQTLADQKAEAKKKAEEAKRKKEEEAQKAAEEAAQAEAEAKKKAEEKAEEEALKAEEAKWDEGEDNEKPAEEASADKNEAPAEGAPPSHNGAAEPSSPQS